jgi:RNA-directed DNA polymerase
MLREPKSRTCRGVRVPIVARKPRNGGGAKGDRKVEVVTSRPTEDQPEAVSARTIRAGEVRARWAWTEPTVWTERMLTALEEGVKGGVWYSVMDKVYTPANLRAAFTRVKANRGAAGVDHQTVAAFERDLAWNLAKLADELRDGSYRSQAVRRQWIPKPGAPQEQRPLGIPTVRDRVVQAALYQVIAPIYERDFAAHSYGFRPQRGSKDALRRTAQLLEAGYTYVVDADLKSYFDTIPQDRLLTQVRTKLRDGKVLALLAAFLEQGVVEAGAQWTPEAGTPQGGVLSPLLANLYLDPLDHLMAEAGYEMVRYADDFVILCRSEEEAQRALAQVRHWTAQAGLTLHPEKTRIVNAQPKGGFDFLGYHFERGSRWPRQKSTQKLKETIRAKTKRTTGHGLQTIILDVNRTVRGWFEYFQHSHRTAFPALDSWVRMRLRSILRKRTGQKGKGRGADHQRWPNAFFQELGLYSMTAAHTLLRQSLRR